MVCYWIGRASVFSLANKLLYDTTRLLCARGGGGGIEKILPTDRAVPTLFKQIQRKYFFDQLNGFLSIISVKVFFPSCMI
jgi:hypothetical protein